jgi:hypothetical protein
LLAISNASLAAATFFSAMAGGNFSRIAATTEASLITPVIAAKPPSSAAFGTARPTCFIASSLAGQRAHSILLNPARKAAESELVERLHRVEQDVAANGQPAEQIDLMQQRLVLDDQRVGREHRLAQPDLLVVDAAKRHDGCTHALGAEARKCLRMTGLRERGDRSISAPDRPLATSGRAIRLKHMPSR